MDLFAAMHASRNKEHVVKQESRFSKQMTPVVRIGFIFLQKFSLFATNENYYLRLMCTLISLPMFSRDNTSQTHKAKRLPEDVDSERMDTSGTIITFGW